MKFFRADFKPTYSFFASLLISVLLVESVSAKNEIKSFETISSPFSGGPGPIPIGSIPSYVTYPVDVSLSNNIGAVGVIEAIEVDNTGTVVPITGNLLLFSTTNINNGTPSILGTLSGLIPTGVALHSNGTFGAVSDYYSGKVLLFSTTGSGTPTILGSISGFTHPSTVALNGTTGAVLSYRNGIQSFITLFSTQDPTNPQITGITADKEIPITIPSVNLALNGTIGAYVQESNSPGVGFFYTQNPSYNGLPEITCSSDVKGVALNGTIGVFSQLADVVLFSTQDLENTGATILGTINSLYEVGNALALNGSTLGGFGSSNSLGNGFISFFVTDPQNFNVIGTLSNISKPFSLAMNGTAGAVLTATYPIYSLLPSTNDLILFSTQDPNLPQIYGTYTFNSQGSTSIWNGTGSQSSFWSQADNWLGQAIPGSTTIAVFDTQGLYNNSATISINTSGLEASSLVFLDGPYNLEGPQTLQLYPQDVAISFKNTTVTAPLSFSSGSFLINGTNYYSGTLTAKDLNIVYAEGSSLLTIDGLICPDQNSLSIQGLTDVESYATIGPVSLNLWGSLTNNGTIYLKDNSHFFENAYYEGAGNLIINGSFTNDLSTHLRVILNSGTFTNNKSIVLLDGSQFNSPGKYQGAGTLTLTGSFTTNTSISCNDIQFLETDHLTPSLNIPLIGDTCPFILASHISFIPSGLSELVISSITNEPIEFTSYLIANAPSITGTFSGSVTLPINYNPNIATLDLISLGRSFKLNMDYPNAHPLVNLTVESGGTLDLATSGLEPYNNVVVTVPSGSSEIQSGNQSVNSFSLEAASGYTANVNLSGFDPFSVYGNLFVGVRVEAEANTPLELKGDDVGLIVNGGLLLNTYLLFQQKLTISGDGPIINTGEIKAVGPASIDHLSGDLLNEAGAEFLVDYTAINAVNLAAAASLNNQSGATAGPISAQLKGSTTNNGNMNLADGTRIEGSYVGTGVTQAVGNVVAVSEVQQDQLIVGDGNKISYLNSQNNLAVETVNVLQAATLQGQAQGIGQLNLQPGSTLAAKQNARNGGLIKQITSSDLEKVTQNEYVATSFKVESAIFESDTQLSVVLENAMSAPLEASQTIELDMYQTTSLVVAQVEYLRPGTSRSYPILKAPNLQGQFYDWVSFPWDFEGMYDLEYTDKSANLIVTMPGNSTLPTNFPGNPGVLANYLNEIDYNCSQQTQALIEDLIATQNDEEQYRGLLQSIAQFKVIQFSLEKLDLLLHKELEGVLYSKKEGTIPFILAGYDHLSQQAVAAYKGYNGYKVQSYYQFLGVTHDWKKVKWLAGLGAAESYMNLNPAAASASYPTVYGTLGASMQPNRWEYGLKALFGYSFINTQRNIKYLDETARSNHGAWNLSFEGKLGYRYEFKHSSLACYDALSYLYGTENNYTETGAPGANFNVKNENLSVLRNAFGFVFKTKTSNSQKHDLNYILDASWVYEYYTNSQSYNAALVGSDIYASYGVSIPTKNFGRIHTGFIGTHKKFEWKLAYTGLYGKNFIENSVSLKLANKF